MNSGRKSAGRPPKALLRKIEDRKGIMQESKTPGVIFELIHDNPEMFKALLDSSKKISDKINIIITPVDMKFIFKSKGEDCTAITEIYGAKLMSFFCNVNKTYSCLSDNIIKILKTKKKYHNKITFYICANDPYGLYIILTTDNNINEKWKTILDPHPEIDLCNFNKINYQDYPLSFTLNWHYLKETLNSWKSLANGDVIIEKDNELPLRIIFQDGQVPVMIDFEGDQKFNNSLKCNLNELIAISVPLKNLLYCSSADAIADYINFFIVEQNLMVLTAKIDESFVEKNNPILGSETSVIRYYITLSK